MHRSVVAAIPSSDSQAAYPFCFLRFLWFLMRVQPSRLVVRGRRQDAREHADEVIRLFSVQEQDGLVAQAKLVEQMPLPLC